MSIRITAMIGIGLIAMPAALVSTAPMTSNVVPICSLLPFGRLVREGCRNEAQSVYFCRAVV